MVMSLFLRLGRYFGVTSVTSFEIVQIHHPPIILPPHGPQKIGLKGSPHGSKLVGNLIRKSPVVLHGCPICNWVITHLLQQLLL